jgi:uncharacterized membrane protein
MSGLRATLRDGADGWRRFWFEPQPTSTLAVFRIAFGLVVTAWTGSLAPDLLAFYGPYGIEPGPLGSAPGEWGLLDTSAGPPVLVGAFVVLLVASVALTLGLYSRLAAIVVFVGVVSFQHRNGLVDNSGDLLIRNFAFYCVLAPTGAALSLDRLRTSRETFWQFPDRAPWALRLVQIELSVGYLSAVWHKVSSDSWRDGTAIAYALRMLDLQRMAPPAFLTQSVMLTEALTFGTLGLELALGVLVWNRAARPWVLAIGVAMHLMIEVFLTVGFFGFAVLVAYTAFLAPDTARRFVLAVRDRVVRRSPRAPGGGWTPAPARTTLSAGKPIDEQGDRDDAHSTGDLRAPR